MFLRSIHIWNYRLLLDTNIQLDDNLTLIVGKNNTGKTSFTTIMQRILSGKKELDFADYPIACRKILYETIWEIVKGKINIGDARVKIPKTKIQFDIDYSNESEDEYLGSLSPFIIDLDLNNNIARIQVEYQSLISEPILSEISLKMEQLKTTNATPDLVKHNELLIISKYLSANFNRLFEISVKAINPSNPAVYQMREVSQLRDVFVFKKISAERGLDELESHDKKPIGQVMERIFQSNILQYEDNINDKINKLKEYVEEESIKAQDAINSLLEEIISKMIRFGYPTAEDLQLKATTQIMLKDNIINDTDLAYSLRGNDETLPSTHNGLGYKNLIKIVFLLQEFAQEIKKNSLSAIPLLFLEEPEAHMHPQLQTVFVKYIGEVLEGFSGNKIQTLISTHSSYIANTVPFKQVRYLKRLKDRVIFKNLSDFYEYCQTNEDQRNNLQFLHKYMTISRCDLYFCDKAILVEGAAERLLIPDMISKCDKAGLFKDKSPSLASQYCSIIEIGGAYAHKFFEFIDFLGIPTLILTDIDFVNSKGNKCLKENAKRTSNATIMRWCRDKLNIAISTTVKINDVYRLISENSLTNGLRHIEFQKEESGYHARSLEEAIMNANRSLYGIDESETKFSFNSEKEKKTDFSLQLLVENSFSNYIVPSYIVDGLIWLNNQDRISYPVQITVKEKKKRNLTIKTIID
ncbi:MAG: AAA family ATPase [Ruminococcus flavefaciens]|nr:AAA family ATPase [Ruminococcus flavefaciens]